LIQGDRISERIGTPSLSGSCTVPTLSLKVTELLPKVGSIKPLLVTWILFYPRWLFLLHISFPLDTLLYIRASQMCCEWLNSFIPPKLFRLHFTWKSTPDWILVFSYFSNDFIKQSTFQICFYFSHIFLNVLIKQSTFCIPYAQNYIRK
jgi:hypothetical protein